MSVVPGAGSAPTEAVPAPGEAAAARRPGLVLALGAGGAAGLAHVGVLQVLVEHGIAVRAIVGSSIGAEIGAFYASGLGIDRITELATGFDWLETLQLFLPDLPAGGLVSGQHIVAFLHDVLGDAQVGTLSLPYLAIATDLVCGEQHLIEDGPVVDAVRASIAIPGLIAPLAAGARLLIDGGLINPLPVDVARARYGGPLVGVAIDAASRQKSSVQPSSTRWADSMRELLEQPWMGRSHALRTWLAAERALPAEGRGRSQRWSRAQVLDRAREIPRFELVRQRLARAQPDLVIEPEVLDIGTLEFYRAEEAIAAGRRAALAGIATLHALTA